MADGPLRPAADGVTVAVRLTPKAAAERLGGLIAMPDGSLALKAAVTAAPEDGRANAALLRMLAKAWRLPKSTLRIAMGAADRRKLVHVDGDAALLAAQIEDWLERNRNG
ncbi:MAG: DUF167 domain-containing protein [Alphaproteobacteria bacterium]